MYYHTAYQVPPPICDYRASPSNLQGEIYHSLKQPLYTPSPSRSSGRSHSRRASHSPASYIYASPTQMPPYLTPQQFTYDSPLSYTTKQAVPKQQRTGIAAGKNRMRSKADRSPRQAAVMSSKKDTSSLRSQKIRPVDSEDSDEYVVGYTTDGSPPPPYNEDSYYHSYPIDQVDFTQAATYKQVQPPTYRSRARAVSHPGPQPQKRAPRSTKKYSPKSPPVATAEDAARAGIPAGYSYKNWDPTETPIFLLGSVFDANSLGKWIYDWTVFHHGPTAPIADLAGDLWLGLIELASKIKRADECLPRIRSVEDRDLIEDFLEGGERLWDRLGKILKACEDYMWQAAKKQNGGKKTVAMGANSGCEFVDSMFGRDRKLEDTEKLMTRIRHWTMRFDACCEDILRQP